MIWSFIRMYDYKYMIRLKCWFLSVCLYSCTSVLMCVSPIALRSGFPANLGHWIGNLFDCLIVQIVNPARFMNGFLILNSENRH